jgi:hypothetical protein
MLSAVFLFYLKWSFATNYTAIESVANERLAWDAHLQWGDFS